MRALRILLALILGACRSEPPEATGRLDRPSGLVSIPRPATDEGAAREDLLIVDSEAEGVKVLQYLGNGYNFVHAPVVYFPLVIPAPNFPTEIAVPVANVAPVDHAYVLSPGDATLHVIDVTPLEFGFGPGSGDGNTHLRSINLDTLGPNLIPTDVVVVDSEGTTDLVAVSFEGVGTPAALILLRLDSSRPAPDSGGLHDGELAGSITVLPSPRGISARGVGTPNVSVLLSSSTSSITEVSIDANAANAAVDALEIDASGPTENVLDAGAQGAFAIRSDRPRVVHFVPGPAGLMRSNARDASPYTPFPDRGTRALRGTIDVYESPIGAAVVGFIQQANSAVFFDPAPISTAAFVTGINHPRTSSVAPVFSRDDGPLPVLLMAHVNGNVSFVAVPDVNAELVTSVESFVARISTSTTVEVQAIDPDAGNALIGQPCREPILCPAGGLNEVTCPELVRDAAPGFSTYRATYRGAMVRSDTPMITPVSGSTTAYRFADPGISSFVDRFVLAGDRVLAQVQNQNCDDPSVDPIEVVATGTVTAVEDASLVVEFGGAEFVQTCPNIPSEQLPLRSARWEVYPGDESMVLATHLGAALLDVVAREPLMSGAGGWFVDFTTELAMRISSSVMPSCSTSQVDILCLTSIDCGIGRGCFDSGEQGGCFKACSVMCDPAITDGCIEGLVGRDCTSVELEVLPTVPFVFPAGLTTNTTVPTFAPAGAAFSPARQAFLISFPGSRVVVDLRTNENGQLLTPIR